MLHTTEAEISSNLTKNIKFSGNNSSKKIPTYVVAFSLKETYDDLATAQQMICNKKHSSSSSITPTNSPKLMESNLLIKSDENNDDTEINDNTFIENNDPNITETLNVKKEANDVAYKEKVCDNELKVQINEIKSVDQIKPPEIIFNSANFCQKIKQNKLPKRKLYNSKAKLTIRNRFKCKVSKNTINSCIDQYCVKAKQNIVKSDNIQLSISDISSVVSRRGVLKKTFAKVNLLEENYLTSISEINLDINDKESLLSHPSTIRNRSFISDSSQNTLILKSSTISSLSDSYRFNCETVNSAIEIDINERRAYSPYKTDVIDATVSITYKESKVNAIIESVINNQEKFTNLTSLTSDETDQDLKNGSSRISSGVEESQKSELSVISNDTLVIDKSSLDISNDAYDMARTSSEINQSIDDITFTLNSNTEDKNKLTPDLNKDSDEFSDNKYDMISDQIQTVVDLGYNPDIASSSTPAVEKLTMVESNNVIVTEHTNEYVPVIANDMGDNLDQNMFNCNVLKKAFGNEDVFLNNKIVNVQNKGKINAFFNEQGISQQMKCSNEIRHPSDVPELWDRLLIFLDESFSKLEESVSSRVVRELSKTFSKMEFQEHNQSEQKIEPDVERGDVVALGTQMSQIASEKFMNRVSNQFVECNLVQNKLIDRLMLKLTEGPKIIEPSSLKIQELKQPKSMKELFEVLKPPIVASHEVLVDQLDSLPMTTVTEEQENQSRLSTLFLAPLRCISDNVFIVTIVPAFFVLLLFAYGLLLLIIRP